MLASHKPILEPTSNRFETNIKFRIDNKFVLQHAHIKVTTGWFELWISCIQFRPSCGFWNFYL